MVDAVKRDILNLYEDDFRKIDQTGKLSLLFDSIPAELNKNASRYQVSSVLANERADSILEEIAQLESLNCSWQIPVCLPPLCLKIGISLKTVSTKSC